MPIQKQIDDDLRSAMLAGDKPKAEILRVVKSTLAYEALNNRSEDKTLSDDEAQKVLAREAKKRSEAAELYKQAGHQERHDAEMAEVALIETYLPQKMPQEDLQELVKKTIAELGSTSQADMGRVIGAVRQAAGPSADGALIAQLVREALSQ